MASEVLYYVDPHGYPLKREHAGDVGLDLRVRWATLQPNGLFRVYTGVHLGLPKGAWAEVRSRSGMAAQGVGVFGGIGTIDTGYTGEIRVALQTLDGHKPELAPGTRIAQLVLMPDPWVTLRRVFSPTSFPEPVDDRGVNGHGSTGAA